MIVGDVAARTIIVDLELQRDFSWMMCCGDGGRNCHGVEVFCQDCMFFMQNLACFVTLSDVMRQYFYCS